jgi:hypothetical protein
LKVSLPLLPSAIRQALPVWKPPESKLDVVVLPAPSSTMLTRPPSAP